MRSPSALAGVLRRGQDIATPHMPDTIPVIPRLRLSF